MVEKKKIKTKKKIIENTIEQIWQVSGWCHSLNGHVAWNSFPYFFFFFV